jgi:hypothetical protein
MTRPIFIIDCFARTERIEKKLNECLTRLKSKGASTMLVSNTPVGKKTLSLVDYFLYDSENHLFNEEMKADDIKLFHRIENMYVWEVVTGVQRHGLSVLRNLFKSLRLAKEYGYTHFHRVEVDDLMGDMSLENMMRIPGIVQNDGKKGLFFINDNEKESNISFHYMYCDIQHFLDNVMHIESQADYLGYLRNQMSTDKFRNVEEFVRHNINPILKTLKVHNGKDIGLYFKDTVWNTEISQSNLDQRFKGCTSRIYRLMENDTELLDRWVVITYNYNEAPKKRRIELLTKGRVVDVIEHEVESTDCWCWNMVKRDIDAIRVFEGDQQMYVESVWEMHPEQLVEIR